MRDHPGEGSATGHVQLEPCGSATGRIVDKDKQPVPGVVVRLEGVLPRYTYSVHLGRDFPIGLGTLVVEPDKARNWET
jgi:hypothetical protein